MDIPNSGMFVIPSVFGYLLGGQLYYGAGQRNHSEYTMLCLTESQSSYPSEIGLICQDTKMDSRYPDIDEFMKLEVIGINDCPIKDDDSAVSSSFKETVKFRDGRYHVKWPYIEDKKVLLPNNFQTAISRLNSLGPRLQSKPHLLEIYRKTIRDQIDRGFIERVPDHQLRTTNLVHYLPHHPVFKPSSATTKVRIVYDASSRNRKDDVSLNECLYRGPVILPDLCQLLIRFRAKDTVVVSDIEKAFLQVALQDEDRDVTRFLWFKNDETPRTNWDNIAVYRFCRVPFGIICSPFLLGATICHHLEQQESAFAKRLVSDIYVDNVISGIPDDMTPLEYYQKTKGIFERAGMNLREFCYNSSELMAQLPKEDRVNDPDTKVLGLGWDSAGGDTLRVTSSTKWKDVSEMNSKRDVLKVIASIFDPLGFFQPSIFEAKVFLQKLWALEKGWDEHLHEPLMGEWAQIWASISQIIGVRIPRFIGPVSDESVLIGFGDAAGLGYGAVVYLRTRNRAGAWVTNLLLSKSRLAPQKRSPKSKKSKTEVSLPRLELLGTYMNSMSVFFLFLSIVRDNPHQSAAVNHCFRRQLTIFLYLIAKQFQEVPSNPVTVGISHPLGYQFFHVVPIRIGPYKFHSVADCYWACFLAQHHLFSDAERIINDPGIHRDLAPNRSESFALQVIKARGIPISSAWRMMRDEVLYAILCAFFDDDHNRNMFRSFILHMLPEFTDDTDVLAVANGCGPVLTCGFAARQVYRLALRGLNPSLCTPGNNVYGNTVYRLLQSCGESAPLAPFFTVPALLSTRQLPAVGYTKTAILISESMLQHVEAVEGGDVFCQEDFTAGSIAEAVQNMHIDLTRYHVVVLCMGTVDSDVNRFTAEDNTESLERFFMLFKPLIDSPNHIVIINTGIGVVGWPYLPAYTVWFRRSLQRFIGEFNDGTNILFCDWSDPGPDNPSMLPNREPDASSGFLDEDGKLPSHSGTHRLLARWRMMYRPLANVEIKVTKEIFPNGQLLDRS